MKKYFQVRDSEDLWNISGSFGNIQSKVEENEGVFVAENNSIRATAEITDFGYGVKRRTGKVKNISNCEITINALSAVFLFEGGEYDVYSQYNGWENESEGAWQPLVSGVCAESPSVRNTHGATPFMALWNNQTSRGMVFHLITYSSWRMRIKRVYDFADTKIVAEFETGCGGLEIKLLPGEEITLPEILFYEAKNKTDLDCHKLHFALNKAYPDREMPVIYNTWLYRFDGFTYDDIVKQIEKAAELGVEYFVIDAGWFGDGDTWFVNKGDWEENLNYGFRGRMKEIAEKVREHKMKFGFWLEAECANRESKIVKEHPEYFVKADGAMMLLNFARRDALEYIFDKTCELIDRYDAYFIKFDFNGDKRFDEDGYAFLKYFEGHCEYIRRLKEKYPHLYFENCASGGQRMSIRDGRMYDSFWLSDDQSPYHGIDIFKDTLLRMPPQWIECWATVRSVGGFAPDDLNEKLIASHDAGWGEVIGVYESYLKAFLTGCPIGLSCDLTALSDSVVKMLKEHIEDFKTNRAFWRKAGCHILTDTKTMQILEYRDEDFDRIELVVIKKRALQKTITLFPVLDANAKYCVNGGGSRLGAEIMENGIELALDSYYTAKFMSITKA